MDISLLLFYGGIAGMAGTALIGVFVVLFLSWRKKKLQKKLEEEYGPPPDGKI